MVVASIPDPAESSAAARADSAAPSTVTPDASHAARAASNAKVLPVPAAPTTTSTPAPEVTSRATMARCSSPSAGRAASAAASASGPARATPAARPRPGPLQQGGLHRQQLPRGVPGTGVRRPPPDRRPGAGCRPNADRQRPRPGRPRRGGPGTTTPPPAGRSRRPPPAPARPTPAARPGGRTRRPPGQPVGGQQPGPGGGHVHPRRVPARSGAAGDHRLVQPQRRRPPAPLLDHRRRLHPVVPGVDLAQRARPDPPGRHLGLTGSPSRRPARARADEVPSSAIRSVISARRRENSASSGPRNPATSAAPSCTGPHRTPKTAGQLGPQRGLVQEPGGPGEARTPAGRPAPTTPHRPPGPRS